MAKIEDLIAQIPDEKLRKAIGTEVKALKKTKKFGLVFEEHLPETVRLPRVPVREGELVALKRESGNQIWRVKSIEKGTAICDPAIEGYPHAKDKDAKFLVADLVAVRNFGDPIYPALVPVDRVGCGGPDKSWHVIINADNFHALQLLSYCYEGKVDVIYIDPPYNTGAKDWKYNNDYVEKNDHWRHSKWLAMMSRRLDIAKRLLRKNGVLICTIDDNELPHLWMVLDSVFPDKKIVPVTIQHNPGGTQGEGFSVTHEYALFILDQTSEIYRQQHFDGDTYNLRRWGSTSGRFEAETCFYPIYVKEGEIIRVGDVPPDDFSPKGQTVFLKDSVREVWPIDRNGIEKKWRYARSTVESVLDRAFVIETAGRTEIKLRRESEPPRTVWTGNRYNAEAYGTDLVKSIVGKSFPYPKSLYAEHDCLLAAVRDKKEALIVDFFAGSGTTLHAVNLLNIADGGNRRCILVTNNEVSDKEAGVLKSKGLSPGDPEWEEHGICESVTWPRSKFSVLGNRDDGTELTGEYITGKSATYEKVRRFTQIGFVNSENLTAVAKKKQLVSLIDGIPQSAVSKETMFIASPDYHATVLFDSAAADEWLSELESLDNVTDFYIVSQDNQLFSELRAKVSELLGPITVTEPEKRLCKDGFPANVEYYRLDFLDPSQVARGDAFQAILPILWMMAGCQGDREDSKGSAAWFIPKKSPFAVLLKEKEFRAFKDKLSSRKDIEWVFLVTDSEENFALMRRALGRKQECVQLYKSYLENFRLNTPERLS